MGLVLVTPPDGLPLDPAEVIAHLRLEDDVAEAEEALLSSLMAAAGEVVEHRTHRALLTQTWQLTLDWFPCPTSAIRIPKPPLQSITSITYVDAAGATQTLASPAYVVDSTGLTAKILPTYGTSWPPTRSQPSAVIITFVAGYDDPAKIPESLRAAMKLLLANWYENREATISGTIISQVPMAVAALLEPHEVIEPF